MKSYGMLLACAPVCPSPHPPGNAMNPCPHRVNPTLTGCVKAYPWPRESQHTSCSSPSHQPWRPRGYRHLRFAARCWRLINWHLPPVYIWGSNWQMVARAVLGFLGLEWTREADYTASRVNCDLLSAASTLTGGSQLRDSSAHSPAIPFYLQSSHNSSARATARPCAQDGFFKQPLQPGCRIAPRCQSHTLQCPVSAGSA